MTIILAPKNYINSFHLFIFIKYYNILIFFLPFLILFYDWNKKWECQSGEIFCGWLKKAYTIFLEFSNFQIWNYFRYKHIIWWKCLKKKLRSEGLFWLKDNSRKSFIKKAMDKYHPEVKKFQPSIEEPLKMEPNLIPTKTETVPSSLLLEKAW